MDERYENKDHYSKSVRAGKRTYFFDVKAMRDGNHYLIVTESKKSTKPNGDFTYEKHKIFLYPEDFDKFMDGLHDALNFIHANQKENTDPDHDDRFSSPHVPDFEDL
ncbi:MAG: PUR family DNA/RNA-binding protein [Flavobacteriales bacterium]|nr:PUR family DNA/RNA-binding protein [Flavobacteriales bacterium]